LFRESYKYFAGVSPQDSLMAIGMTTMTQAIIDEFPGFIDGVRF